MAAPALARPRPLQLRCPEGRHEVLHDRYVRARRTLAGLGFDVGDLEHLELGDVALPLEVLEALIGAVADR